MSSPMCRCKRWLPTSIMISHNQTTENMFDPKGRRVYRVLIRRGNGRLTEWKILCTLVQGINAHDWCVFLGWHVVKISLERKIEINRRECFQQSRDAYWTKRTDESEELGHNMFLNVLWLQYIHHTSSFIIVSLFSDPNKEDKHHIAPITCPGPI